MSLPDSTTLLEREFSAQMSLNLPDAAFRRFTQSRYASKVSVFSGKELIVWSAFAGAPRQDRSLRLASLSTDLHTGVEFLFIDENNEHVVVGHTPVEVAPAVFIWAPRFTTVERYHYNNIPSTRATIAIKSPHSPHYELAEGISYITDKFIFENT